MMPNVRAERKSYDGRLERTVEAGRHVYRTTRSFNFWMIAIVSLAGAAATLWVGLHLLTSRRDDIAIRLSIGPFLCLIGLVFIGMAVFSLTGEDRLEITPAAIRFRRRWSFLGPKREWQWKTTDVVEVSVTGMPTFHLGGMTPVYGVGLRFMNYQSIKFHVSFDENATPATVVRDITASINEALDQPGNF